MIEEIGTVVALRGPYALVRTERSSACEGCGSSVFCTLSEGGNDCIVEAKNPGRAAVGRQVRVAIPTASFLKGTFFLYLFPLIGLFAGMAAGYLYGGSHHDPSGRDLSAALGGILGLISFFGLQRLLNHHFARNRNYHPVIHEIL